VSCQLLPERIHLHMHVDVQNAFRCLTSYTFRILSLCLWVLRCGSIGDGWGMEEVRITVPNFRCEIVNLEDRSVCCRDNGGHQRLPRFAVVIPEIYLHCKL
jgi:hypothetical protein